eukprot:365311-Chlamydomonas_euryale.AAC.1
MRHRTSDDATYATPAVGSKNPTSMLSVVDLPAPLGPSRPKHSPAPTASDSSRTAARRTPPVPPPPSPPPPPRCVPRASKVFSRPCATIGHASRTSLGAPLPPPPPPSCSSNSMPRSCRSLATRSVSASTSGWQPGW